MNFLTRRELNSININGKRVSITWTRDYVVLEIETYGGRNPIRIPIFVPVTLWKPHWETEEYGYMEITGYLTTEEIEPHVFEYRLEAESIYPSNASTCQFLKPTNQFRCIAYLAQAPKVLNEMHPYIATLFLGTGSFLEDGIFTGRRFQFDVTFLRKKTLQVENLEIGDVIKLKATVTNSEDHGIQIIGKEINLIKKNPIILEEPENKIIATQSHNTTPEPA